MKRLVLFISVFIIGITLSGCDLIDQGQIDDLEELLCTEEPDNPLCDLDSLRDLEEEVIMDVVESTLMKAKEKANKTKCSSLLAPGSTELIEQCALDDDFFLPADVEMFTPISITPSGDSYVITGVTDDPNEELIITIQVVLLEEMYYLQSWTYTYRTIGTDEILYDSVKQFIMDFLRDIQDETISSEEFCGMYYEGIDNDCDDIRTEVQNKKQSLRLNALDTDDDDDGIFDALIEVTTEGMVEEVTVSFEFTKDTEGNLKVLSVGNGIDDDCDVVDDDCDSITDDAIVIPYVEQFLYDYMNPEIGDEVLLSNYGLTELPVMFPERSMLVDGHVTVLKLSGPVDSFFDIFVKFSYMGKEESTTIEVKVNRIDMALVINDGEDNDCDIDDSCTYITDGNVVVSQLEMLFMDYMNPEITDDQLFEKYGIDTFPVMFPARQDLFTDGHVTVLKLSGPVDSFFDIHVDVYYMGMVDSFTLEVRVNRIDMAIIIVDGEDNDCDGADDDCNSFEDDGIEVLNVINQMFLDYYTPDLDDDDFQGIYGFTQLPGEFPSRAELVDGHVTVLKLAGPYDSFFDVVVSAYYMGMERTFTFEVRVDRIELAIVVLDGQDNDCDGIDDSCLLETDITFAKEQFQRFLDSYLDPTVSDEMLIDMYGVATLPDSLPMRSELLTDGHVTVLKISGPYDSFFDILVEVELMGSTSTYELEVKVNRIDMALVIHDGEDNDCDGIDDDCNLIGYDAAVHAVGDYVSRHNHMSTISMTSCMYMVIDTQVEECARQRDELMSKGVLITDFEVIVENDNYRVTFTYSSPTEMYTKTFKVFFHPSQYGVLLELHEIMDVDSDVVDSVVLYFEALKDMTLSTDEVCMLLDQESYNTCFELRNYLATTGNSFGGAIYLDAVGNHVMTLEITSPNGEYLGKLIYVVELRVNAVGDNVLYQSETKEGSNPLFEN